jgi:type IV pilus assembly protein PilB
MTDITTSPQSSDTAGGAVSLRVLGKEQVPFDLLKFIPEESARHYKLIPLALKDDVLEVGMVDPDDIHGIDALNFISRKSGVPFKLFRITESDFAEVLKMYKGLSGEVESALSNLESDSEKGEKSVDDFELAPLDLGIKTLEGENSNAMVISDDAPTIKIASTILRYAIDGGASDVHIEPTTQGVKVRYRVDGELHTSVILPSTTHRALVARFKVLSSIRLDESRKPQDGRFSASIDNRQIDFRVSTFPSYWGEKLVMRILDRQRGFIPLQDIGLSDRNLAFLREAVKRPHGLILISGPTGSGKSTTLYSLLSEVDREGLNVLSLEDPIEYFVEGVTQSQVRPEIGYTFAAGLRTTLRQDPDVIMVGEIRDAETARLAIQAALTGHLVLSTIHTNDAVGTVARLVDMGIEPYLIPPVLIASVAQRLVRTLCDGTGKEIPLSESDRRAIELQYASLPEAHRFPIPERVFEPQKTATCPTGMRGRLAVFEVLEMNSELEKVILETPITESKLWAAARTQGMLTMREDALLKAGAGKVPISEVNTLSTLMSREEDDEPSVTNDVSAV